VNRKYQKIEMQEIAYQSSLKSQKIKLLPK